ncbi:MAG: phosphatase [Oscillospiraceae bacterium]
MCQYAGAVILNYAIVDLGSNTIRMSVYRILPERNYELLFSKKEMAGLVNYIRDGVLSAEGIRRACSILTKFRELLGQFRIAEMHVFATASLRNIRNTEEAVRTIRQLVGVNVEVLSGNLEAELGYYGALRTLELKEGALFDIGGGSTEIVEVRDGKILSAQSLPIGSLNLFSRCVSKIWPKRDEMNAMKKLVTDTLSDAELPADKAARVCAVGGTARAMLKIANAWYGRPETERWMTPKELHHVTKALMKQDARARQLVLNACPDRIHTILPGALLMDTVCSCLCKKELCVSRSGVREGYLFHELLKEERRPE